MALTGSEVLQVTGLAQNGQLSGQSFQTTTGAIAALAASEATGTIETVVSATTGTTLVGSAIVGGQINRSGPTAAYSDTIDTAANIVAALPGFLVGAQFYIAFKNATIYSQTLLTNTGITLPGTVLVPALSESTYFVTIGGTAASPTAVFTHVMTGPIHSPAYLAAPLTTPLTTVGNGVILALGIYGGVVLRGGVQTNAFTDTTDAASALITLISAGSSILGQSIFFTYDNNTTFPATITGGSGVTVSGQTIIPANGWVRYLVTYTAAGTVTMVGVEAGSLANTVVDVINQDYKYQNVAATYVSTIALQQVPGLFVNLTTSGTYTFDCYLPVNTLASAAGIAVAVSASNSLTATAFSAAFAMSNTTSVGFATATTATLGNTMSSTTLCVLGRLTGSINVNTGGTLIVTAAQAGSSAQTTTIAQGGWLSVTRVS